MSELLQRPIKSYGDWDFIDQVLLPKLQSQFKHKFTYGGRIPIKLLRERFSLWFSLDKRQSNIVLRILDQKDFLELNRKNLIVRRPSR